jgi:uncharacterized protein (DUF488 family)
MTEATGATPESLSVAGPRHGPVIYTIGHSNRSFAEFCSLLKAVSVARVCDVRSLPGSRAHPQFNREALEAALAAAGIDYVHLAALGGRRRPLASSSNDLWENEAFRGYADYAWTPAFRSGLHELERLGRERRCAIMCAEAVWWRCHRRIIADYLLVEGFAVLNILSPAPPAPARLTPGAQHLPDGHLLYTQGPPPFSPTLI